MDGIYIQPVWCLHRLSMANTKNMAGGRVSFSSCLLILSFIGLQFLMVVDAVTDSISVGQVITRSETLVSAGKFFELGFFRPGQSGNYYVGIWYKNIPEQTIVWVANRDLPLTSSSPILTISNDGNLVIMEGKITYKVSEIASSQNTSAILLDSGNLILRDGNSDILWQSFDYPSHTFLPGMKFGYSRKTGKVWSLTSWKSTEDPSIGDAELKMDPAKSNGVFLMRDSHLIWSSGVWLWQYNIFSLMPEMRLNYIYNYSFHSDENETYFTYSIKDSTLSRFIIDVNGQIKAMNWLEGSQSWFLFWGQPKECGTICGPFSICNANLKSFCPCLYGFVPSKIWELQSIYGVCERRTPLQCKNRTSVSGSEDRFLRMDAVNFHIIPKELKVRAKTECELACLNNCSCTAYAHSSSGICSLWTSGLLYIEQLAKHKPDGRTIYIKLSASELRKPGGNKKLLWIIVMVVPLALFASYFFLSWRRKLKDRESNQDILLFDINMRVETSTDGLSDGDKGGKGKSKDSWLPLFSFASVSASTNEFSSENKLGEGGFGPVYKGKLLNGQEVAVKRLSKRSGQGLEELKNETMLIAKLQHRNLVRLLGCCLQQGEKILIYEYMPNKSLDSFLFDPTKKGLLAWGTRVKIIEGIAQGLLYLHQYSRLRIIHRDLKASNILLDSDMNPKISDFGMARMFSGDELQANTNRIVGTYGYMSPEYALEGIFSIKSDVFSFGVLLLEILSGKKNTGFYHTGSLNLLGHSWDLWKDDRALDLLDPILENESSHPIVIRYIKVALLCVQENAADRPTMSEVLPMLTNELVALPSPKLPAFSYVRSVHNSYPPTSRPEACSVNNVTVSLMEAR